MDSSTRESSIADGGTRFSPGRRRGLLYDAWRRFARDRLAIVGLIALAVIGAAAVGAPSLARYAPDEVDMANLDAAPGGSHWFGTDDLGRDEFSRALHAGRVSLSIGVFSAAVAAFVGTSIGGAAGFYGGLIDSALMRLTDIVLSIPSLPLVIVLSAIVKPSPSLLILIIAMLQSTC